MCQLPLLDYSLLIVARLIGTLANLHIATFPLWLIIKLAELYHYRTTLYQKRQRLLPLHFTIPL